MKDSRILVVDDHEIIFLAIKLLLSQHLKQYNVYNARTGAECEALMKDGKYELVILDVNLPDCEASQLMSNLLLRYPKLKFLIFSMNDTLIHGKRFMKHGAMGYLNKSATQDELLRAITTVLGDRKYISDELSKVLLSDFLSQGTEDKDGFKKLTSREFQIMTLILKGYTLKQVGVTLNLHMSTVSTFKARIFQKLRVNNIIELKDLATINNILV